MLTEERPAILLVRHGESEWNASGRWQGCSDIPLAAAGRVQAAAAAAALAGAGIDAMVASPLCRARETAEIIARSLGVTAVTPIDGLREFDAGAWTGLTRARIEAGWPGQLAQWDAGTLACTPNGEARAAFVARILDAVRLVGRRGAKRTVAVTHGGVIGAVQRALAGTDDVHIGNLMGRWIGIDGDQLKLGDPVDLRANRSLLSTP